MTVAIVANADSLYPPNFKHRDWPIKELFFDVETLRLAEEVGGWGNKMALGIAVLKIYRAWDDSWITITDKDINKMDSYKMIRNIFDEADIIVGHNICQFDFPVLSGTVPIDFRPYGKKCLDFAQHIFFKHRFRCSLSNIAKRTIKLKGYPKLLDGIQAVYYWRSGDPKKQWLVERYCERDVELCWFVYWMMVHTETIWKYGKAVAGRVRFYNGSEAEARALGAKPRAMLFSSCIIPYPEILSEYLTVNREHFFGIKKKVVQYTFQKEGMDLKSVRRLIKDVRAEQEAQKMEWITE